MLAEELLQIYAQRASLPGHAFPPADDSFHELEATFPFDETPDQGRRDPEAGPDRHGSPARAMDRLVCGDVGYGKTEVALRAVFRAVQGGKQACILAPTTVLVEQHFRTMTERFAGFPINLGKLSRFQGKGEQVETVKKLAEGRLDVVIGTHRLLSADVRFKDLGLVVIDEEQRFGVEHKERIKKTRTQVDVLTLTATPIPRTLHLAMANLRDLSIIATPPADRRAVRTFVSRVDDTTIREAIDRELARGGQLFFITPTIGNARPTRADHRLPNDDRPKAKAPRDDDRTIEEWAERYLRELVPTARVGIGHGAICRRPREGHGPVRPARARHPGRDDDRRVRLDIPRAFNTMFVARADAFGLAQLYQLRGRIGRSKDRAYCYLLVPEPDHLTEEARRRLETLQRFTDRLGAGFQIASQDLELRGGGELLGAKQSGSIAAVRLPDQVRQDARRARSPELGGNRSTPRSIPSCRSRRRASSPTTTSPIPLPAARGCYKRLSAVENDDELRDVMAEIADRYGPVPGDVILRARRGPVMGVKGDRPGRNAGLLLALEISSVRVALALADDNPVARLVLAAGWRRLPDGRYAIAPPAPGGPAGARRGQHVGCAGSCYLNLL